MKKFQFMGNIKDRQLNLKMLFTTNGQMQVIDEVQFRNLGRL